MKVIDLWIKITRKNLSYQAALLIVSVALIFSIAALSVLAFRGPIAIVENERGSTFYATEYKDHKIDQKDVENFVISFLHKRFIWKDYSLESIIASITPISTENFLEATKTQLKKDFTETKAKDLKIEQTIVNIQTVVDEKKVQARFDKVVKVNGIPLVVSSEVSLQIVDGEINHFNPMGLYVHGLIEHEEKR